MDIGAAKPGSASSTILLAVCLLGLLVVVLSFLPWMTYGYAARVVVNGIDMKGFTDAGDGWATAIAGGAAALVAIAALLWKLRGQLVGSAITAFGLVIAAIAGYDLIKPWEGPRPGFLGFVVVFEITREPALWVTGASGLGIAVAGLALLVVANRRQPLMDGPNEPGETQAWA